MIFRNRIGKIAGTTLLTGALVLAGATGTTMASDRSDQVSKEKAASDKAAKLRASLEDVSADLANSVIALEETKDAQKSAQGAYDEAVRLQADAAREQAQAQDQLEVASAQLKQVEKALAASQERESENLNNIGKVARETYTNPTLGGTFEFFISDKNSGDLSTYARNAQLAAQMQADSLKSVQDQIVGQKNSQAEQRELTAQVRKLKEQADAALQAADGAKADKQKKLDELNQTLEQKQKQEAELESKKGEISKQLEQAEKDQQAARDRISQIDAKNRSSQGASSGNSGGGTAGFTSGSIFQGPIKGPLILNSPFGYRVHPITGGTLFHQGADIAASCGQPQFAAADGTVVSTQWEGTGGNTVTINHGMLGGSSWISVYRHMTQFATSPGARVSKGQLIGYTGTTGQSTGCHVHFELWKNGSVINPIPLP
ncbi:peptidoglycan DD-metalloendopeptidase family protein [Varibaculum vaginae]|uniref:peptidoglycan DD-metalloendopeptidase family protein n=1 Tax=Varibaculum vaginae TaxID=2364797 RepID=UPI000F0799F7|nr:M23 family metallopeptidase [Varibaculum vaginae]